MPRSAYQFESCGIHFGVQKSRVTGDQRSFTSSAFVAGNLQFVYKNCAQLKSADEQNELNDVLFSHCLHPNSGIAFELLFSVIAHQPDDFVCPICTFAPVVPRMTYCGHIFCADCIERHALSAPTMCPVCYEPLDGTLFVRADVRLHPKQETYKFCRVIRSRSNCVCFLPSSASCGFLPSASSENAKFCRFMLADPEYAKKLVETERADIRTQIEVYREYNDEAKNAMLEIVMEAVDGEEIISEMGPRFALMPKKTGDYGVFYQEASGRLMFLDPLSNKMLKAQFGAIAEAPDSIEFVPLKETGFTVDQRFRKRFPLLGHLPTGADVRMVLADLSGIVTPDVLSAFAEELEIRTRPDDDDVEEDVEEVKWTPEDFPDLTPSAPTRQSSCSSQKSTAWTSVKVEPKRSLSLSNEEEFPVLSAPAPQAAKKPSPWTALKL